MGFDVGAILANLLMSYFSQEGHEEKPRARDPYREWILDTVEEVWTGFRAKFLELWRHNPTGDGYPKALFADERGSQRLDLEREAYMDRLFEDSLGFAAAKMIRRILGLAHNIDFEWIKDAGHAGAVRGAQPEACPRADGQYGILQDRARRDHGGAAHAPRDAVIV